MFVSRVCGRRREQIEFKNEWSVSSTHSFNILWQVYIIKHHIKHNIYKHKNEKKNFLLSTISFNAKSMKFCTRIRFGSLILFFINYKVFLYFFFFYSINPHFIEPLNVIFAIWFIIITQIFFVTLCLLWFDYDTYKWTTTIFKKREEFIKTNLSQWGKNCLVFCYKFTRDGKSFADDKLFALIVLWDPCFFLAPMQY